MTDETFDPFAMFDPEMLDAGFSDEEAYWRCSATPVDLAADEQVEGDLWVENTVTGR